MNDVPHSLRHGFTKEAGFSLVELLVAMAIVGIMGTIAIFTFGSSKSTIRGNQVVEIAQPYRDAIERFRSNHGGRSPAPTRIHEWPSPLSAGPVSYLTGDKPYISDPPPDVTSGAIVVALTAPIAATTAGGWIRVRRPLPSCVVPNGCRNYVLQLYRRSAKAGVWREICYMSNYTPPTTITTVSRCG